MRSLSLALLLSLIAFPATLAAAPQLQPLGGQALQIGATTVLTLTGADLLPAPRLILSVPVAKQELQPGPSPSQIRVAITLAADVPPGSYALRVATPNGISNAVLVGVDDLIPQPFGQPVQRLPAAVTSTLGGSDTARITFTGKKGQRIVVEIDARRLGSALDPVLELFTADRRQIAWAMGSPLLGGDARLEAALSADGSYTVDVHDVLYQGAAPGFFRLKVGELRYADLALPLGVQRKAGGKVELIGNLTGVGSEPVSATTDAVFVPAPLPRLTGLTGPAPALVAGDDPEVLQGPQPAGKLQEVTAPAAINGRLATAGAEDRYKLLVKAGERLRFDVWARRLGSPLDGVLTITNESGAGLASSDDRPDTIDPGLDFTVPAGVKAVIVGIRDEQGRGGPSFVYRIAVTPLARPDVGLTVLEDRALVPQGGVALLRVQVQRNGFSGPIRLSVPGLPTGITLSAPEIPAGATEALLSLAAPPSQAPAQLVAKVVGTATDAGGTSYSRTALQPTASFSRETPWLRAELGLAVTPAGPFSITWDGGDDKLTLGTVVQLPLRVTRSAGATGPVRLVLVTSQIVPKTREGKEDTNRALRLEGTPTVPAGQSTFGLPVRVPGDLPANIPYDLAVRAELLSPDGKTVVATAVSPSRRVSVAPVPKKPAGK